LLGKWRKIRAYRAEVMRALEELRIAGKIGSSLQAEVRLHCAGEKHAILASLGDDLRFVLICSQATVIEVLDSAAEQLLCAPLAARQVRALLARPRRRRQPRDRPGLCGRCVSNLDGEGESRAFA
jgi:isoleucyl-tRNA synthetase